MIGGIQRGGLGVAGTLKQPRHRSVRQVGHDNGGNAVAHLAVMLAHASEEVMALMLWPVPRLSTTVCAWPGTFSATPSKKRWSAG